MDRGRRNCSPAARGWRGKLTRQLDERRTCSTAAKSVPARFSRSSFACVHASPSRSKVCGPSVLRRCVRHVFGFEYPPFSMQNMSLTLELRRYRYTRAQQWNSRMKIEFLLRDSLLPAIRPTACPRNVSRNYRLAASTIRTSLEESS